MASDAAATTFITAVFAFLTAAMVAHASAGLPASTASTPTGCAPAASHDLRVHLINEAGAAQQTLVAAVAQAGSISASAGLRLCGPFHPFASMRQTVGLSL